MYKRIILPFPIPQSVFKRCEQFQDIFHYKDPGFREEINDAFELSKA